ncbi:hypothetical protein FACS189490_02860 [Clostridia bacterium]|nr:hypothetical protein FACS189490_02860 [Clostridia bacterium]
MEVNDVLYQSGGYVSPPPAPVQEAAVKAYDTTQQTSQLKELVDNPQVTDASKEKDEKLAVKLPSDKALLKAVDSVNKLLEPAFRNLDVSVHDRTKRIMVKVVDTATKEVVREIPSKESLEFLANILERSGVLLDKRG